MNKIVTASLLLTTGITISAYNVITSTIAHHDTSSDGSDQWQQKASATLSIIKSPAGISTFTVYIQKLVRRFLLGALYSWDFSTILAMLGSPSRCSRRMRIHLLNSPYDTAMGQPKNIAPKTVANSPTGL